VTKYEGEGSPKEDSQRLFGHFEMQKKIRSWISLWIFEKAPFTPIVKMRISHERRGGKDFVESQGTPSP